MSNEQKVAMTVEMVERGMDLIAFAGGVFQERFQAGGYRVPSQAQHGELIRAISQRAQRLVFADVELAAARADLQEFTSRVMLIVLGDPPISHGPLN